MKRQRVLIVGSGGREHALAWKLRQSPDVGPIYVAPGNGGTAALVHNIAVEATDIAALVDLVEDREIDLTVVGPEAPLALGLADMLRCQNRLVFGPDRAGARMEASKAFAKDLMTAVGVPTAAYAVFDQVDDALAHLRAACYPLVIKADALAAGKGVTVCASAGQAQETVRLLMVDRIHGHAGERVVIEEALHGPEVSLLALVDGEEIVPLPIAQDHKRLRNGDRGPNTGGMGAYAPVPFLDAAERAHLVDVAIRPVAHALARAGTPYRGVLYAGLMLTCDGPRVLEYNCRFGDPEAQVILPLIAEDLFPWLRAVAGGGLKHAPPSIDVTSGSAVGVVLAAHGYPDRPRVGDRIAGLLDVPEDVLVFHAGTARNASGDILTAGGRVVTVVGRGPSLDEAVQRAYSAPVDFPGMQLRSDIARPACRRRRVGVLASGDGSNLQALLDASAAGALAADICIVIASSTKARALDRARRHHVPAVALPRSRNGYMPQDDDRRLLEHLRPFDLDLLVLAGWMHVLSTGFLESCPFPIINVHPALLSGDGSAEVEVDGEVMPVLRGLGVVERALALGLPRTGVTIHHVTDRLDSGPIVLREAVPIEVSDSTETLYRRIKSVEHRLLVDAVRSILPSADGGVRRWDSSVEPTAFSFL